MVERRSLTGELSVLRQRQTANWTDDHFVGQKSAIGQPSWPLANSAIHPLGVGK